MRIYTGNYSSEFLILMIAKLKLAAKTNKKTIIFSVNRFCLNVLDKLVHDCLLLDYKIINFTDFVITKKSVRKIRVIVRLPAYGKTREQLQNFVTSKSFVTSGVKLFSHIKLRELRRILATNSSYILLTTNNGLWSSTDGLRKLTGGRIILYIP
jgi:ribosomal protein S8